jgi:hypothetical protein
MLIAGVSTWREALDLNITACRFYCRTEMQIWQARKPGLPEGQRGVLHLVGRSSWAKGLESNLAESCNATVERRSSSGFTRACWRRAWDKRRLDFIEKARRMGQSDGHAGVFTPAERTRKQLAGGHTSHHKAVSVECIEQILVTSTLRSLLHWC